jgi:sulfur carrier protein
MTSVTVNGARWQTSPGTTVAEVVDEWCASRKGIAVALNGEVVPKSTWADTTVHHADEIEIVTAAAGG